MLDLLALQFHGCRPVSDNADRFLETDALQGSLFWKCVTDILGCPPRFLCRQTNKWHEVQRCCTSYYHFHNKQYLLRRELKKDKLVNTHRHTWYINLSVCIAVLQCVKLNLCSSRSVFWLVPTTRGHQLPCCCFMTDQKHSNLPECCFFTVLWMNLDDE